jgi:hypothetical protein
MPKKYIFYFPTSGCISLPFEDITDPLSAYRLEEQEWVVLIVFMNCGWHAALRAN